MRAPNDILKEAMGKSGQWSWFDSKSTSRSQWPSARPRKPCKAGTGYSACTSSLFSSASYVTNIRKRYNECRFSKDKHFVGLSRIAVCM
jgi:hypothetical protein